MFDQNTESVQYNAGLAITGVIKGILKEKIYQELGFESLQQRRWKRKRCCLFKLIKDRSPSYLFQLVHLSNTRYLTINSKNIPQICMKPNFLKNSFFPQRQMSGII